MFGPWTTSFPDFSQAENATMVVLRLAQSGAVTAAGKPGT